MFIFVLIPSPYTSLLDELPNAFGGLGFGGMTFSGNSGKDISGFGFARPLAAFHLAAAANMFIREDRCASDGGVVDELEMEWCGCVPEPCAPARRPWVGVGATIILGRSIFGVGEGAGLCWGEEERNKEPTTSASTSSLVLALYCGPTIASALPC